MKRVILSGFLINLAIVLLAQSPQAFKYQSVVRDNSGEIIASQSVSFRISIHDVTAGGTIVYQETHDTATNEFGLANLEIGNGTVVIGTFSSIDWGSGDKFLEVELDPTGSTNYISMGTSQLLSVPYAQYSEYSNSDGDWVISGNDLYSSVTGHIGIGTPTPEFKLSLGDDGGILAEGTYGSGLTLATAGSGARLIWYPKKAAFRAGNAVSDRWDDSNIGEASMATGYGNIASGDYSSALGINCDASGHASFSSGVLNTSNGDYGISMGLSCDATGNSSTALGQNIDAEAYNSFVIGYNNIGGGDPSLWIDTDPLFEIGNGFSGPSNALTVLKNGNTGIGTTTPEFKLSLEEDGGIIANGTYGLGASLTTSGAGTRLIWYPKKAAFRAGTVGSDEWDDSNIGNYSLAIGLANIASENFSIAMGGGCEALGQGSVSLGQFNTSSGYWCTSIGLFSLATGQRSTAIGIEIEAKAYNSFVIGTNNVGGGDSIMWVDTDPLFEIGNGYWDEPSNAMTVLKNGHTGIGTVSPTSELEVVGTVTASSFVGDGSGLSGISDNLGDHTATENLDMAGFRITNLADPIDNNDAATKEYVDTNDGLGNHTATQNLELAGNWLSNDGGNEGIFITNDGKVGVGESSPEELLHINGGKLKIGNYETFEDGGIHTLATNSNLKPLVDDTRDLGRSNYRWTDVYATNGTIQTSDRREKENIRQTSYGLNEVMQLKPVAFTWKNKPEQGEKLGLIAQDILEVIPEVVKTEDWETNQNTGQLEKVKVDKLGVYYSDLIPVLIKGMQEQQDIIEQLEARIRSLEREY